MYPRGGGVWDQDPILMRDFRIIATAEREWKQVREQMESMKNGSGASGGSMGDALNNYIAELDEDGTF